MNEQTAIWLRWTIAAVAGMVIGGFLTGMYVAARYEARLGKMARETSARDNIVELLWDPATRVVVLEGAGPHAQATGRVVWQARRGGHLLTANLPPAPAGKTYETWVITRGQPRAAGVFRVDTSGQAIAPIPPVGDEVDSFVVTLEAVGGGRAPTGPIVLASANARLPGRAGVR